jgi:activator of HSP90 ATPase
MNKSETNIKTKDLGFQVSIRKTFSVSTETMWEFLLSAKGIAVWLGKFDIEDFEIQRLFITEEGIEAKLTVFTPNCHLRIKWKPKHFQKFSTVELRVTNNKGRASVIFHHTGFFKIEQQEELRSYWKSVILRMNAELIK